MSWKTAATVLIIVFVIALLQSLLASPALTLTQDLNQSGDYDNQYFNGNNLISGYLSSWFDAGLVAIFGMMVWGFARVVRKELFRGRRGGGGGP